MSILQSSVYKADIAKVLENARQLEKLRNKSVLITGATGLVCSAIVDLLISSDLNIVVYAAGRSRERVNNRFGESVKFVEYDATKPINFDVEIDYIIHGASNATPNLYVEQPVETMKANIFGVYNLLEYARKKMLRRLSIYLLVKCMVQKRKLSLLEKISMAILTCYLQDQVIL